VALPDRFAALQELLQAQTVRLIIRWSWVQVPVALSQRLFFKIDLAESSLIHRLDATAARQASRTTTTACSAEIVIRVCPAS